jgi:hypothetical protein
MIVLEDEGGVEVIPANVDRIGFLDEPCESVLLLFAKAMGVTHDRRRDLYIPRSR